MDRYCHNCKSQVGKLHNPLHEIEHSDVVPKPIASWGEFEAQRQARQEEVESVF